MAANTRRDKTSKRTVRRHQRQASKRLVNGEEVAVRGSVVNPDGPDGPQGNGGATYTQASAGATSGVEQLVDDRTPSQRYAEAARLRAAGGDKRWRAMATTHEWVAGARYTISGQPSRERLAAAYRELEGIDQHISSLRKVAASIGESEAEAIQAEIQKIANMYTALAPTGIRATAPVRQQKLDQLTDEEVLAAHQATENIVAQLEHLTNQTSEHLTTDDNDPVKKRRRRGGYGGEYGRGGGGYGRGGGGMMGGRGRKNQNQGKGDMMNVIQETFKKMFGIGGGR